MRHEATRPWRASHFYLFSIMFFFLKKKHQKRVRKREREREKWNRPVMAPPPGVREPTNGHCRPSELPSGRGRTIFTATTNGRRRRHWSRREQRPRTPKIKFYLKKNTRKRKSRQNYGRAAVTVVQRLLFFVNDFFFPFSNERFAWKALENGKHRIQLGRTQ